MSRYQETNRTVFHILLDVVPTLLALYLASWARLVIPWGRKLTWEFVALPWPVYVLTAVTWPVALFLSSAYRLDGRHRRFFDEARTLLSGIALGLLVLAGALYLSYRLVPRRQFFYFGLIDVVFLVTVRAIDYVGRRTGRRDGKTAHLLVVGAGQLGLDIVRQVRASDSGLEVIGFVDDAPSKEGSQKAGVPVLGRTDDLKSLVESMKADGVIFALPLRAHERLMQLVLSLEGLPVEVDVVPDYFDLAFYRTQTADFYGIPLVRLRASAIEGRARAVKRVFDLTLAVPLLILCLPFLPIIALAIRLDSPGPVFFRQVRVGENCRRFHIWKLRTMVENAEELLGEIVEETPNGEVIYKRPDDPRVTRVGRVLRRYSVDELPQLVNVIRGEMSLVGPRPELPWMVERYRGWERKRFAAPPGITGWWQVSGRASRGTHVRVEDDLYYIQNYSIWLDLRILWRTIGAVLSGRGAY